jgi:hypothetical protein
MAERAKRRAGKEALLIAAALLAALQHRKHDRSEKEGRMGASVGRFRWAMVLGLIGPITTRIYDLGGRLNHPVAIGGAVVMPGDAVLAGSAGARPRRRWRREKSSAA